MAKRRFNFVEAFFMAVVFQLCGACLLAPGDTGVWLRYTIVYLGLFDVVVYLVFYSGVRHRQQRQVMATKPQIFVFAMMPLAIAIAGSYLTPYLHAALCAP